MISEIDGLLARCIDREQAHMDGADEKMIARAHGGGRTPAASSALFVGR